MAVPRRRRGSQAAARASGREGVGAVGLGRPHVGVAEVGQLDELVPLGVEVAGQRQRHAGPDGQGHAGLLRRGGFQNRTMQLWLAVASSVPSSANMWTSPWPKPWSTACTRMSSSTHSVGHEPGHAQRVVEAVAAAEDAERLADAHRHVVAEHGQRRGVDGVEQLGDAGPHLRRGRRRACRRGRSHVAAVGHAQVEPLLDRAVDRHAGRAGRAVGRRRHALRASAPTGRRRRAAGTPSAALTVRISRLPTWPTARAWVIWWPTTARVTSMSRTSPSFAYSRYCAVAQMHGRPAVPSMAEMAAPRPLPPNRKPAAGDHARRDLERPAERVVARAQAEERAGVHRRRTLGSADLRPGAPAAQAWQPGPHDDRRTLVGRRLLPRRRLPARRPLAGSRSWRRRWPPSSARELNAVCFVDAEAATASRRHRRRVAARSAACRSGVKELDRVAGWPYTHASVAAAGRGQRRRWHHDRPPAGRRRRARRPDDGERVRRRQPHPHQAPRRHPQPVAARPDARRLVGRQRRRRWPAACSPLATGGDGGGSIRIPAGFTGLFGLKATFGRIPLGPRTRLGNLTVTIGCLSRSVRDTARWFDVCNGHDSRDPLSLPAVGGWEAGLGTLHQDLRGLRVAWSCRTGVARRVAGDVGACSKRRRPR